MLISVVIQRLHYLGWSMCLERWLDLFSGSILAKNGKQTFSRQRLTLGGNQGMLVPFYFKPTSQSNEVQAL